MSLSQAKSELISAMDTMLVEDQFEAAKFVIQSLESLAKAIEATGGMKMELTKQERDLVQGGLLINAIKMVRSRTNLGLKEAKDLCEGYRNTLSAAPGVP